MTACLKAGDHVVVSDNTYGGTYRLFERVLTGFGLVFDYVDASDAAQVLAALRPTTRMVFLETPTNPLMRLCDIAAIAQAVRPQGIHVVVDNTFMSPYFQRPLMLGANIVVHSTTKYLNGHSDSLGGVVVVTEPELAERLAFVQNAAGAILSPMDAWLTLRGIKTLVVRMQAHDANGRVIAQFLREHPRVMRVYYPGLPDHPQHQLAIRQMSGFGGMVAFDVGDLGAARQVLEGLRVFALAESLGGVESLACHPATMTHASVPPAERQRLGITEGLVRLSVGIEDVTDLLADLERALASL
jgi:cystathionine gamma-lyase/cystathionine beta-lyase/cystathionine gamma-lyase/homocysteine desulfhydrase